MTFDAWQLLVNFGTKPLDENELVFECSEPNVDAIIKSGKMVYQRVTPHLYAAFDRGFYFQPVLIECNLSDYLETVAREPSVISLNGITGEKEMTDSAGKRFTLPFYPVYILVNRTLFNSQRPREDEDIWLGNLTQRRRAIAHELLYAKQYAEFYNVVSDTMTQSVSNPTAGEEEQLMCPMEVIEKTLNTFEVEHGLHFLSPGDFVDADSNVIKSYFDVWLRNYAVPERVCREQTENYLRNGVRGHVRNNVYQLKQRISGIINEQDPKSQHFRTCLQNGHPHAAALNEMCREIGDQFAVTNSTIVVVISHALDFTNGAGI